MRNNIIICLLSLSLFSCGFPGVVIHKNETVQQTYINNDLVTTRTSEYPCLDTYVGCNCQRRVKTVTDTATGLIKEKSVYRAKGLNFRPTKTRFYHRTKFYNEKDKLIRKKVEFIEKFGRHGHPIYSREVIIQKNGQRKVTVDKMPKDPEAEQLEVQTQE